MSPPNATPQRHEVQGETGEAELENSVKGIEEDDIGSPKPVGALISSNEASKEQ